MRLCNLFPPALALLAFALPACGGGGKAISETWTGEVEGNTPHVRQTEALNAAPLEVEVAKQTAWIGVRHDLMLAEGAHPARCSCLAVEIGAPNSSKFFWSGGFPEIGNDALAVALGARGIACPGGEADDTRRRPSISAVDREDNNIVIEVEELPDGRPLASGAIIPKPKAGGGIFVRPRTPRTPYGQAGTGAICRVQ